MRKKEKRAPIKRAWLAIIPTFSKHPNDNMASLSSPSSSKNILRYVKLSEKTQAPVRAFVSTRLTLYSAVNVTIPPHGRAFISTDLRVAVPCSNYGWLIPKSLLTLCHVTESAFTDKNDYGPIGVDLVFDEDYRNPLGVPVLNHHVDRPFQINEGNLIALLMCETVICPEVIEVDHLEKTYLKSNRRKP